MINLIANSTIHGVSHIYGASNKIWKTFWFILLFVGVIAISVNVVIVILKFLRHPILLSYTFEYKPFVWPEITFCNPTAPFYFQDDSREYKYWNHIVSHTKETAHMLAKKSEIFRMIHGMKKTNFELEERTLALSSADLKNLINISDVNKLLPIIYTSNRGNLYLVSEPKLLNTILVSKDLSPAFSTRFVQFRNNIPCYTFHVKKLQIPDLESVQSIQFLINLDYKSYEVFNSSYITRSIFLYLSNEDELPNDDEIFLTPGFQNEVTLTQSVYHYHDVKRKCRLKVYQVELYDVFLQSTRLYEGGHIDCCKVVSQELVVKYCNCYSPFLPIFKNESGFPRLCLNSTFFSQSQVLENARCMTRVYKNYNENTNLKENLLEKCVKYQLRKCNFHSYKVNQRDKIFIELWSKKINKRREMLFASEAKENLSDYLDHLKNNFIRLILFRNSNYSEMFREEDEYPFSELLSDIGGLMGLWLGMSVVGLFELAEIFYMYLRSLCTPTEKRDELIN